MKKSRATWQRRLGEHIRAARKNKGYTQTRLGDLLGGLNRETIRLYEAGGIAPPLDKMRQLVDLLEVDFVLDGCRICRETLPAKARAKQAEQGSFDFRTEYRAAYVKIRATRGEFKIRGTISA